MGDKTGIEWTDATWNPVTGCDRVSPGCDHCYALTLARRLKAMGVASYQTDGEPRTSGPGFGVQCHPHMLDQPLRWKRPRMIFVNSMSDLFHQAVPNEFIVEVFARMLLARQHIFQILTKRPQRMARLLADPKFDNEVFAVAEDLVGDHQALNAAWCDAQEDAGEEFLLSNVWLGTTVESDAYSFRADHLRATPAAVRFISAEPLLGPLPSLDLAGIDWLIVGGESGPGARPMHPDWARQLRDRCSCSCDNPVCCECGNPDVAFHFKQWGEWSPPRLVDVGVHERFEQVRVGKKAAGRMLDGRTWDEFPTTVVSA